MVRNIFKYGAIGGAVLTALFAITFLTGLYLKVSYFGAYMIGIAIIIAGLMVIGPAVLHQKTVQGGGIGFKKAFGIGMGVSTVTAVFYGIASLIIFNILFTAYQTGTVEGMYDTAFSFGHWPSQARFEEIEMASMNPIYYKPWLQTVVTLTAIVPVGLLMSFISARLTNTRP